MSSFPAVKDVIVYCPSKPINILFPESLDIDQINALSRPLRQMSQLQSIRLQMVEDSMNPEDYMGSLLAISDGDDSEMPEVDKCDTQTAITKRLDGMFMTDVGTPAGQRGAIFRRYTCSRGTRDFILLRILFEFERSGSDSDIGIYRDRSIPSSILSELLAVVGYTTSGSGRSTNHVKEIGTGQDEDTAWDALEAWYREDRSGLVSLIA